MGSQSREDGESEVERPGLRRSEKPVAYEGQRKQEDQISEDVVHGSVKEGSRHDSEKIPAFSPVRVPEGEIRGIRFFQEEKPVRHLEREYRQARYRYPDEEAVEKFSAGFDVESRSGPFAVIAVQALGRDFQYRFRFGSRRVPTACRNFQSVVRDIENVLFPKVLFPSHIRVG